MTDRLSLAVYAFASRVLMSVSVDETLIPSRVNLSTSFKDPPFSVENETKGPFRSVHFNRYIDKIFTKITKNR